MRYEIVNVRNGEVYGAALTLRRAMALMVRIGKAHRTMSFQVREIGGVE